MPYFAQGKWKPLDGLTTLFRFANHNGSGPSLAQLQGGLEVLARLT